MDATLPEIRWLETRMSRWDDLVAAAADTGVRVTPETAMRTAAYMACARVVAETVACLPLHVYRRLDDHSSERAKDLAIYNVLAKRPNRYQTRYQWVEQICLHMGFYGSSYQFKFRGPGGQVTELRPLNPAGMKVEADAEGTKTYLHTDPQTGRQTIYRDDQICHIPWLSFDGIHGEVPIELGRDAISLARSLEGYAANFYRNQAQPGLILTTDQVLNEEQRRGLRESWNARHKGARNAGETAVLSNGLKADTITATNQESQLAELWMQSLLAICRIWRMPPHMIQELGRATWGNLQSEMVSFEKFTIAPWLRRIEGAIERDVLPEDGELYAEFLVEGLLRSDITTRYQAYEIAIRNRWLTPEEVRMKENLGPMPEGDDSPGEVEDTPGDMVEDVAEVANGTSEDMPAEQAADQPSGRSLPQVRGNEDQPRDEAGKWTSGGSGGDTGDASAADSSSVRGKASPEVKEWADKKFSDPEHAKAFTEWFGDSQVVNEKGEPLVVYHGTTASFDEFSGDAQGSNIDAGKLGKGFYFSTRPEVAAAYATNNGNAGKEGAKTIATYLSISNPLEIDTDGGDVFSKLADYSKQAGISDNPLTSDGRPNAVWSQKFTSRLQDFGYDGVALKIGNGDTEYVAFKPTQIKSATGNSGTFDPNSPNIKRHAAASTEASDG